MGPEPASVGTAEGGSILGTSEEGQEQMLCGRDSPGSNH